MYIRLKISSLIDLFDDFKRGMLLIILKGIFSKIVLIDETIVKLIRMDHFYDIKVFL